MTLKELVAKNKFEAALTLLEKELADSEKLSVVSLQAQHSEIIQAEIDGTWSLENIRLAKAQLRVRILELGKDLKSTTKKAISHKKGQSDINQEMATENPEVTIRFLPFLGYYFIVTTVVTMILIIIYMLACPLYQNLFYLLSLVPLLVLGYGVIKILGATAKSKFKTKSGSFTFTGAAALIAFFHVSGVNYAQIDCPSCETFSFTVSFEGATPKEGTEVKFWCANDLKIASVNSNGYVDFTKVNCECEGDSVSFEVEDIVLATAVFKLGGNERFSLQALSLSDKYSHITGVIINTQGELLDSVRVVVDSIVGYSIDGEFDITLPEKNRAASKTVHFDLEGYEKNIETNFNPGIRKGNIITMNKK